MNILNYKLDTTNELLTARIGLLATAHTVSGNNLPCLGDMSYHWHIALVFLISPNTLILSQHEGAQCLDDTTHIAKDKALRLITNQSVPTPQAK
jgi:hypothetical protein